MDNSQMSAYRKRRKNKAWKQFVHFVACLVIFCTVYVLVLPAFTLEEQQQLVRLCAKGNKELLAIQKKVLEG
jgi:hypothetical protein